MGEDNESIFLGELGLSREEYMQLRDKKVI